MAYKNLIILLADQLRHDAVGYAPRRAPSGVAAALTPHIDALAARGCSFTHAYTPLPVCAPARQALMSGRHPDSFGGFWNHGFFHTPPFRPEATLTQRLADSGRRGCFIGKWDVAKDTAPSDFGFHEYHGKSEYQAYVGARYPNLGFGGGYMGCESPVAAEDADTHFYARKAADFIRAEAGRGGYADNTGGAGNTGGGAARADAFSSNKGFFLWADFGVPHLPCRPSAPFSRMYDPADIAPWPGYDDSFINKPYTHRQQRLNWRLEDVPWEVMAAQVARYYGVVSQLDDAIGRIVAALDETGQRDDTLIVLTSDHGDMCGNHRMFDKHNTMYDDIVRVPLLLSGRNLSADNAGDVRGRGFVSGALVSNCLDLPPTILALMGLPGLPDPHGRPLPGIAYEAREHSLEHTLERPHESQPPAAPGEAARSYITSSSNGQQFGMFNTRMITDGRYKYVWNLTDTDELYDGQSDPGELYNLIGDPARASLVKTMRASLYEDLKAHGDPFASGWLAPQLLENRKA